MRKQDLFRLCLQNLLRKKSRTLLTVLGVVIGGCSIVIMVSLGIGMKESQERLLSELGDLTIITVSPPQGGKGKTKLDAAALRRLQALPGVTSAMPRRALSVDSVRLIAGGAGRYRADWAPVLGVEMKELLPMGFGITRGEVAQKSGEVVLGQYTAYGFQDTLRPEGANTVDRWGAPDGEEPPPFLDPLGKTMTLEIETESGKFQLPLRVTGIAKEDYSKGSETSEGILMSLEDLEKIAQRANPGKKQDQNFDAILVKTSSISKVAEVEKSIKAMGYATESMESVRAPMEKEARQKQMMLGGLGAISLIVAAIGIANTMMMSISERTREIGIMKALGCFVRDIRLLFLAEAGVIGLAGGIVSCVVSLIAATVTNLVSLGGLSGENLKISLLGGGARVCVVPLWLLGFAILFSVLIGLGSGYYPAGKAVRIPALEAIKNE
ncbi:MAG TPA: ABC transporter permease [Candidatus Pygmaiobacter gallistercoris]|nr:ABC transporter permease [Candidatus Pygmaiobacter gallistercoris]